MPGQRGVVQDLLSNRPLGQRNDDRWPTRRQTTASKLTATVTATTTTFDAHRRQAASLYSAAARLTLRSATPERRKVGGSTPPLTTIRRGLAWANVPWRLYWLGK